MGPSRRGALASTLCILMLALVPFGLFWRVALGKAAFAEGDLLRYNYPLLRTIAAQWRAGEIPLWNPYLFGGTPLHGNMQGGVFYPPNLILLIPPTWLAYQHSILLHFSMAGAFTFLFLRALGLGRAPALAGSLVFMLGGFTIGHLGHVSTVRTIPWMPLTLYGFERWRRSLDLRHAALAAVAVGLMLLAGHPQVPLYALLVTISYALWCVRAAPSGRWRVSGGLLAILLLGTGLAAVQILPTAQLAGQEYLRPDGRSYAYFVNFSLHPAILVNLFFPRLVPVDEAELAVYVGVASLLLAIVAVWRPPPAQRSRGYFFTGWALLALVLAFGGRLPLARLLFHVPLYNLFTAPARSLFEFDFAVAVLAALGAHRLERPSRTPHTRRVAIALFCAALLSTAGAIALGRLADLRFPAEVKSLASLSLTHPAIVGRLGILAASLGLVWWHPRSLRKRRASGSLLVALLLADLGSYAQGVYRQRPTSDYTEPPPVTRFLEAQARGARIVTWGLSNPRELQTKLILGPDVNASYDIESINGFDSLMLRQIDEASGHVMPTYGLVPDPGRFGSRQFRLFMDLLGARYVVTTHRQPELARPRYRRIYDDGATRVYENSQALPRLWLAPCERTVTHPAALAILASGRLGEVPFDPGRIALLESDAAEDAGDPDCAPDESRTGETRIRSLERRAGFLRVAVDSPTPGVLLHSCSYSRGWRVEIDGRQAPLYRADGLIQGVRLPRGSHEVVFAYRPRAFVLGAGVSVLATLLLVFGSKGRWRTQGSRRGGAPADPSPPPPVDHGHA